MEPFITSVVIPTFNSEKFIGAQLTALAEQEYDGTYEVIVVNNRSTDGTFAVVEEYGTRIDNLRLVEAPDRPGTAYATNVGVKAARGHAILRIDSDDIVTPGWLAPMAEALKKNHLVAGSLELANLNLGSAYRTPPFTGSEHRFMGFLPFVIGCNLGFSREAFDSVGGFTETIRTADDVDFTWRVQLKGYQIHDVPEAVVQYRYRENVRDMVRQNIKYGQSHVYLYKHFRKHGMPKSNTRMALKTYKRFIRSLPRMLISSKLEKQKYVREVAAYFGRLKGSLKYRTLYL